MMLLTYINKSSSSSSKISPPSKPFGLAKREYSTSSRLPNSITNCTSVVLWGSNLSSTLGLRYSDKLRNIISLPLYIKSIVVGLLLSDGWFQKGKYNKNARLGFFQCLKHIGFALWIYSVLALLTPVALAVWAQGDGSKIKNGFKFSTHSFTIQQTVLLLSILNIKYGLNCAIYYDRGLPVLHVKPNSMATLRALVTPHFHPSMLYKLR